MPQEQANKAYFGLLHEYVEFLARMVENEKGKLAALSSRNLTQIEHSITVSQADAKRLENYEAKRLAMQAEAGYEGLSFREILDKVQDDLQRELLPLFTAFENYVAEIRFYNDKSMALARDNMMDVDPTAVLPGQAGAKPSNPYQKQRVADQEQDGILQTKI